MIKFGIDPTSGQAAAETAKAYDAAAEARIATIMGLRGKAIATEVVSPILCVVGSPAPKSRMNRVGPHGRQLRQIPVPQTRGQPRRLRAICRLEG
jgi:hypothetical protein